MIPPQINGRAASPRVAEARDDEVHIWRISLEPPPVAASALFPLLSAGERARAARFHSEAVGNRFAVGRGALRTILGRYLGRDPRLLEFRYGARGKPALADGGGPSSLRFNLAHSRGLALLAVALGRDVGVDVEGVRHVPDAGALVARFFSAREGREYRSLPESEKVAAFFRGWTRKEAFVKATGDGLSMPLDRFDVSLAPPGPGPILLDARHRPEDAGRWLLRDLDAGEGFAAAVAVEGDGWRVRALRFDHAG